MRVCVAGPSDLDCFSEGIIKALKASEFTVDELVFSGTDEGVARAAWFYADTEPIDYKKHFPKWQWARDHRRSRAEVVSLLNAKNAEASDALVVIKRKYVQTPGTYDMILQMEQLGKPVYVHEAAS